MGAKNETGQIYGRNHYLTFTKYVTRVCSNGRSCCCVLLSSFMTYHWPFY